MLEGWKTLTVVAALTVLTTGLAGCLGSTDPSSQADDAELADGVPASIALDGCREILGTWQLPYAEAAPYLPPGFQTFGGGFLGPATGANVTMDMLAFSCTEPQEAAVLLPWLYAEPPDHLLDAQSDAYRLALPCIGDASIVEQLQGWGVPCIVADAEMTVEAETPGAAQWAFQAENDDVTVRLEGQGVDGDERSIEPVFGQFHAIDGELCAFTRVLLEDHIHWRGHGFTMTTSGDAPFPAPDEPGDGLLALPDIRMNITPVATAQPAGTDETACPSGQMPANSSTLPTAATAGNRTPIDSLPDGSPIPDGFNLTGCSEHTGIFPVDPNRAPELPDGFSHVPGDPAAATATLEWTGRTCQLEGQATYTEMWGAWRVQPPADLARDGADIHLLTMVALISEDRQVDIYEAWGMEQAMLPARMEAQILQDGPPTRVGHVRADDGANTAELRTTVAGEDAPEPARTARIFGASDGEVTGAMDLSWTEAEHALMEGEATWTLDRPLFTAPIPPEAGQGLHRWGAGYDLTVERVDLDTLPGR